jgi:pimeloyl-ACP methyl ester carboxylesterase
MIDAAIADRRSIEVDGIRLNVEVWGSGEPLLLLHGFPDSGRLWRRMIPELVAAGFYVIVPDQRGFGESSAPDDEGAYAIDHIAADAIAILDQLGIESAMLMGHDWGAVIGWKLAADHPERFSRFVAISVGHPNSYARGGWLQKLKGWYVLMFQLRGLAEAIVRAGNFRLLRFMTANHPEATHWIADLRRAGRLTAALNWYRANFALVKPGLVGRVAIPVLGIWSSGDVALSEKQMATSGDHVGSSFKWHRIEGAGHWLPLDRPDAVNALAIPFLRQD